MRHLRRPSPALSVSFAAVFIALSGTAVALQAKSVGSKQIKKSAVKSKHVSDGSLKAQDIAAGALGQLEGDPGPPGSQGPRGPQGDPGTSIFDSTIPAGKTVTGAWGGRLMPADTVDPNNPLLTYSFPVRAPEPLIDLEVNFGAETPGDSDADPGCAGSIDAPTAPPGNVCIYVDGDNLNNTSSLAGFALVPGADREANALGFIVRILAADNEGSFRAEGTWAYTAP